MNKIYNNSINNKCSHCKQCCTDFIPITNEEITRIKEYMKINHVERNYAVDDNNNNYILLCSFISDNGCQIYEVRPEVCRGFCCWESRNKILRNKDKCINKADYNGRNNYASLHTIFWNDHEFTIKLITMMKGNK